MGDFQHIQQTDKTILSIQTGIPEPATFTAPLCQPTVIIVFLSILYDKGNDVMTQTLFECHQSANPAIAILKRMDIFKFGMKGNDVFHGNAFPGIILGN